MDCVICVICETSSESQKVYFNFNWKPELVLKYFKNELNFCKEFDSEDKLYCGTYCYNSCNTFSRSESGAETRSQTFQFLIDILNQNQVVEQVSTELNLYTLQHVVEFVIYAFYRWKGTYVACCLWEI